MCEKATGNQRQQELTHTLTHTLPYTENNNKYKIQKQTHYPAEQLKFLHDQTHILIHTHSHKSMRISYELRTAHWKYHKQIITTTSTEVAKNYY